MFFLLLHIYLIIVSFLNQNNEVIEHVFYLMELWYRKYGCILCQYVSVVSIITLSNWHLCSVTTPIVTDWFNVSTVHINFTYDTTIHFTTGSVDARMKSLAQCIYHYERTMHLTTLGNHRMKLLPSNNNNNNLAFLFLFQLSSCTR